MKDGKVDIDGEIGFLFMGSPEEHKKLGSPIERFQRSTLVDYIEEAIKFAFCDAKSAILS